VKPDLPARRLNRLSRRRAFLARDPGSSLELLRAKPAPGQRRRADEHDVVLDERLALELRRDGHSAHDGKLDLVGTNEVEGPARRREPKVELDRGMLLVEARKRLQQEVGAGNPGCGEGKGADLRVPARGECPASVREQCFGAQHVVRQHLSRRSQYRALPVPDDERRVELRLE
jgi:hypothetical protein